MTSVPDEIEWLTSSHASPFIEWATDQIDANSSVLSIQKHLRTELPKQRAIEVIKLATLRKRASQKFSQAHRMYFSERSLEQATSEIIALYKASIIEKWISSFNKSACYIDLCCGIGSDSLFMAPKTETLGFDIDPGLVSFANANAKLLNNNARFQCKDVTKQELPQNTVVHIDPDRRVNSKTTSIEYFQPGLEFLEKLIALEQPVAIKLAPATSVPDTWKHRATIEWIGHQRESKQQVAWFGFEDPTIQNENRSKSNRLVTIIENHSFQIADQFKFNEEREFQTPQITAVGKYLYEPHSAVLSARAENHLAVEHELKAISNKNCYLTSDVRIERSAIAGFEVLDCLPMKCRTVQTELERIGAFIDELKYRSIEARVANPFRNIKTRGELGITLFLTPSQTGYVALITKRLDQECDSHSTH